MVVVFLVVVVVVVAVDPYIYKITNNFLTCKIYFILYLHPMESRSVTTPSVSAARPSASMSCTDTTFMPFMSGGPFRVGVSLIASGRVIARALRSFVAASHAVRLLTELKAMTTVVLATPLVCSFGLGPVELSDKA